MSTTAFMHFGGLAWFTFISMLQLNLIKERAQKVNRIFLISGGSTVRLQFNNGKVLDVPLSGIHQISYDARTSFLSMKINSAFGTQTCYAEIGIANSYNLALLFAVTRKQVN